MARRFSPEFNREAQRIVKSFNQRVRRAERRGIQNLPQTTSLRELKARFSTEHDLKKELGYLRKMNTDKEALGRHFLGEGSITNWEFNYLKDNLKEVKAFYNVQLKMAKQRYKDDPSDYGLKQQIVNLEARKEYLERDLNKLTYSELKTFRKYTNIYKDYNRKDINYFNQYLKALDELMGQAGVPKDRIKSIKEKINALPPDVFIEVYRRHDVIDEVFRELYKLKDMEDNQPVENLLSPADRAAYEQQQRVWMDKFSQSPSDQELFQDKMEAMDMLLDEWIVEAEAGLMHMPEESEFTTEELRIYNKYFRKNKK